MRKKHHEDLTSNLLYYFLASLVFIGDREVTFMLTKNFHVLNCNTSAANLELFCYKNK